MQQYRNIPLGVSMANTVLDVGTVDLKKNASGDVFVFLDNLREKD